MTFDDLLNKFLEICPNGELCEDNEGQIVFYTNLTESDDPRIKPDLVEIQ